MERNYPHPRCDICNRFMKIVQKSPTNWKCPKHALWKCEWEERPEFQGLQAVRLNPKK